MRRLLMGAAILCVSLFVAQQLAWRGWPFTGLAILVWIFAVTLWGFYEGYRQGRGSRDDDEGGC